MTPQLSEGDRTRLDSIVQQMVSNNEPDESIQAVVSDFKSKYAPQQSVPGMPGGVPPGPHPPSYPVPGLKDAPGTYSIQTPVGPATYKDDEFGSGLVGKAATAANKVVGGGVSRIASGVERMAGEGVGAKVGGAKDVALGTMQASSPGIVRDVPEIIGGVAKGVSQLPRAAKATGAGVSTVAKEFSFFHPLTALTSIPNGIKSSYQAWKASSPGALADAARMQYLDSVATETTGKAFAKLNRAQQAKVVDYADDLPNIAKQEMEGMVHQGPPPKSMQTPPRVKFKPQDEPPAPKPVAAPPVTFRQPPSPDVVPAPPVTFRPQPPAPKVVPPPPVTFKSAAAPAEDIGSVAAPDVPPAPANVYQRAGQDLASKYGAQAQAKDIRLRQWLKSQNIDADTFSKADLAQKDKWAKSAGFRRFTDPAYEADRTKQIVDDWETPQMAKGGIVTKPTRAIIGEAGPEIRVPLKTSAIPTVPEGPETMKVQMDQLAAGKRKAVMFPKGTNLMSRPKGMKEYRDGDGNTFIFNPKLTDQMAIDKATQTNSLTSLLGSADGGMGSPDKSKLGPDAKAVVGKTRDGVTTQSTAADSRSIKSAVAQTEKVTPKNGHVEVKDPQLEVDDRLGSPEAPDKQVDKIRGSINVPLDEQGMQQAEQLGKQFRAKGGVDKVISSDLLRGRQTAEGILRNNPGASVIYTKNLEPWPLGGLEGTPTEQALPELKRMVMRSPAEVPKGINPQSTRSPQSFNRFSSRALGEILRRVDEHDRVDPEGVWVLQGHKSIMRLLKAWSKHGARNDLKIDKNHFFGSGDDPASVLHIGDRGKTISEVDMASKGKLKGGTYLARHGSTSFNAPSGGASTAKSVS